MPWVYLMLAIVLEVSGTTCMKLSHGFTRTTPSVMLVVFYLASIGFLTMAVKHLDISLAYAVWAGLGTALIVGVGAVWFNEEMNALRFGAIAMIIAGVVILHATSKPAGPPAQPAHADAPPDDL